MLFCGGMKRYFLSIRAFSLVLAAIIAAALVAGGCGSSDSQTGSGEITVETGSLSKAEFIKQADAICKTAHERVLDGYAEFIQRNDVPASGPGLEEKAAELMDSVVIPAYADEVDEISSLGAPRGDEQKVSAILEAVQRDLAKGEQQPLYATNGTGFLGKASDLAEAYGFSVCNGGDT